MKILIVGVLLFLTSCSHLSNNMTKRQNAYIDCVMRLNDNGLKQQLIERLCDKAVEK